MATSIQVVRRSAVLWDVNSVRLIARENDVDTHEYETLGRIVCDNGLFYAESAVWKEEGFEYRRNPHGYALMKGALRAITNPPSLN